jgi:restriction endonuclease S subunit
VATNGLKYAKVSPEDLQAYRLNEGDILFNRTNSFELVGKSGVFSDLRGDWVFASYLIRLVVDREHVLPEFVSTLINSSLGRSFIEANARRAIGQVNINARQIAAFEIPDLSLAAQTSFVKTLTEVRQASDHIAEELTETEMVQLRESILREAFAGKL